MVGNGATDYEYDVWPAYVPTVFNFQLISKKTRDDIINNNCNHYFRSVLPENTTKFCNDTW